MERDPAAGGSAGPAAKGPGSGAAPGLQEALGHATLAMGAAQMGWTAGLWRRATEQGCWRQPLVWTVPKRWDLLVRPEGEGGAVLLVEQLGGRPDGDGEYGERVSLVVLPAIGWRGGEGSAATESGGEN